jgi:Flp pilus assembly protein TadB
MRNINFELSKVVLLPLLIMTVITSLYADFEINIFNDKKGKILIVNSDLLTWAIFL